MFETIKLKLTHLLLMFSSNYTIIRHSPKGVKILTNYDSLDKQLQDADQYYIYDVLPRYKNYSTLGDLIKVKAISVVKSTKVTPTTCKVYLMRGIAEVNNIDYVRLKSNSEYSSKIKCIYL